MKTRTTKSPCVVYWGNDLATAMVTAETDQTGRRNIKQEVFEILVASIELQGRGYTTSLKSRILSFSFIESFIGDGGVK